MEEIHCLACTCEGRVATRGGAREGRADQVALALRVAKVAEEVDAGPRAVPVMPLAALAPCSRFSHSDCTMSSVFLSCSNISTARSRTVHRAGRPVEAFPISRQRSKSGHSFRTCSANLFASISWAQNDFSERDFGSTGFLRTLCLNLAHIHRARYSRMVLASCS